MDKKYTIKITDISNGESETFDTNLMVLGVLSEKESEEGNAVRVWAVDVTPGEIISLAEHVQHGVKEMLVETLVKYAESVLTKRKAKHE